MVYSFLRVFLLNFCFVAEFVNYFHMTYVCHMNVEMLFEIGR